MSRPRIPTPPAKLRGNVNPRPGVPLVIHDDDIAVYMDWAEIDRAHVRDDGGLDVIGESGKVVRTIDPRVIAAALGLRWVPAVRTGSTSRRGRTVREVRENAFIAARIDEIDPAWLAIHEQAHRPMRARLGPRAGHGRTASANAPPADGQDDDPDADGALLNELKRLVAIGKRAPA
jgi:hypothetical protein